MITNTVDDFYIKCNTAYIQQTKKDNRPINLQLGLSQFTASTAAVAYASQYTSKSTTHC